MALLDEEVAVDQAAQIVRAGLAQPPWGGAHVALHALDVVSPGFAVAQFAQGTLVGQGAIRSEQQGTRLRSAAQSSVRGVVNRADMAAFDQFSVPGIAGGWVAIGQAAAHLWQVLAQEPEALSKHPTLPVSFNFVQKT